MSDQVDQHGFNQMFGSLRLLDLLGYGNYYAFVDDFFSGESSEMVNSAHIPCMNFLIFWLIRRYIMIIIVILSMRRMFHRLITWIGNLLIIFLLIMKPVLL